MQPRVPIAALEYFDSAARHLSFRRAAEEFGVTPGAVSQRIRALEMQIGHPLFIRSKRGVELTPNGERLRDATELVLAKLASAICGIRSKPVIEALTVTVSPYFGSRWLSQRLEHFWTLQPDIELRLRQYQEPAKFDELNCDVLIKYGREAPSGFECETLFEARSAAVCSPALLEAFESRGNSPVEEATLLHHRGRQYWCDWLSAAGFPTELAWRGQLFEDIHLLMGAAASGQGLALGTRPIIDDDLRSQRLVLAHPAELSVGYSYQFICRRGALRIPKVRAFHAWVSAEARGQDRTT